MSRLLEGGRQHTFSARSEDERLDEGRYIELVTRRSAARSHEVFPRPERLLSELDHLVWHQDEPFGSSSVYAQSEVFALAASHGIKVMLDGQGADEQLAGYRAFFGARYAELWRSRRFAELLATMRAAGRAQSLSFAWSLMMLSDALLPEPVRQAARRNTGHAAAEPAWLDITRLGAAPADPYRPKARDIRELSDAQLTRTNLQMLLHWEDRDSMAHSIEARVPFLDHRLVEFVLGLPSEFKLHRDVTKRVLREAMAGIVPEAVLERRDKLGFVTAEERWMRAHPDPFRAAIAESVDRSDGILRPAALQLFDDVIAGRRAFDYTPWRLLCFGRWLDRMDIRTQ
jgi:asparagine synthase (glutamine-hydrolysing)